MPRMIDGRDNNQVETISAFQTIPSKSRLNEIFALQNIVDARLDLAYQLVAQNNLDITCLANLLKRLRLDKAGWLIEHHMLGIETFFASAFGGNPNFMIQLSVAIPPLLFSVASEIESHMQGISLFNSAYEFNVTSIDSWFPGLTSTSQASSNAIQMALDAALLIYFHEVAHVLFGHCDYQTNDSDEIRALEFHADFNAGTMFALWIPHLQENHRKSTNVNETINRLLRASFLLGAVLKATSAQSKDYHYPSVRTEVFFGGATFGIERAGMAPKHSPKDLENLWINQRAQTIDPLIDALRLSSLKYFAGTEVEINKNVEELKSITKPIYEKLTNGVLADLCIPV